MNIIKDEYIADMKLDLNDPLFHDKLSIWMTVQDFMNYCFDDPKCSFFNREIFETEEGQIEFNRLLHEFLEDQLQEWIDT